MLLHLVMIITLLLPYNFPLKNFDVCKETQTLDGLINGGWGRGYISGIISLLANRRGLNRKHGILQ